MQHSGSNRALQEIFPSTLINSQTCDFQIIWQRTTKPKEKTPAVIRDIFRRQGSQKGLSIAETFAETLNKSKYAEREKAPCSGVEYLKELTRIDFALCGIPKQNCQKCPSELVVSALPPLILDAIRDAVFRATTASTNVRSISKQIGRAHV